MEIKRLFDILDTLAKTSDKPDILSCKETSPEGKKWVRYSVKDFDRNARLVAFGLMGLGMQKNDVAAIISGNRPEWMFADFGIQQAGMISVPIFPTISSHDLQYILNHSGAKVIFISDKGIYQKLVAIEEHLPELKYVISFNEIEGVRHFKEFIQSAGNNEDEERLGTIKHSISGDDVFTILYTSGTTGQPKGVMISHGAIISNIMSLKHMVPFTPKWKALSFLPLCHVYERVLHALYLQQCVSIYYAENFETIGDNCREIHPQVFVAVPRILERVLEKIVAAGDKLTGFKKKIFDMSLRLAEEYELNGANGAWYEFKRWICDKMVYSKWREAVGGEVVCVVSGGAALNPRLEKIFFCAGIPLLQGYGLTETAVVISVNYFGDGNTRFGTVGAPIKGIEVKLDADGEILMKGPSLMKGYYKNPEATAEAIDKDGWFHTGDIGTFIDGKYLKITDRKKELFKTSAGKYISPIALENKLKECKYIENCMVVGANQKFASAIIIPNMIAFKEYCGVNKIEWQGTDAMREHSDLKKLIHDHVKAMNQNLAPYEQLKRCQLIKDSWTVDGGEITPKLSLKRKVIAEKNQASIDKIFAGVDD